MIYRYIPCRQGAAERFLAAIFLALALLTADYALAQTGPVAAPAFATPEDVYTIRNIAADETAETATAARDIALQAARRVAFSRLTRRIVPPQDLARVPAPSDEALTNLLLDFEVADEKSRGQRYLARLTLRFDPDNVRALLRQSNIRNSETGNKAMLIIPVYDSPAGRLLWEANAWRDALQWAVAATGSADDRLSPLLMPLGDLEDVSALNAGQAVAGDMQRLALLLRRYGADGVLLMQAAQSPVPGASGGLAFDVTVRRLGALPEDTRIERYEGAPGEAAAQILPRAAQTLVSGIQEAWLNDTAVDFSQQASIDVLAQLTSFEDWLALQKRLNGAPMVRHIDLQALSINGAQINLQYLGTPEKLAAMLAQQGLSLTQEAGQWRLR